LPDTMVDVESLVAALDAQRRAKDLSWRGLAKSAGVSASTLTRMQQGKLPDVNTFTVLTRWLKLPAEPFLIKAGTRRRGRPHPMAVASTLLRGKSQMSPKAMRALEELVQAAFKLSKELE